MKDLRIGSSAGESLFFSNILQHIARRDDHLVSYKIPHLPLSSPSRAPADIFFPIISNIDMERMNDLRIVGMDANPFTSVVLEMMKFNYDTSDPSHASLLPFRRGFRCNEPGEHHGGLDDDS